MAPRISWRALAPALLSWASLTTARPLISEEILRRSEIQITDIQDSYDYVIVGGGQAGVVIGSRLSEDPDVSVLIVEYGYFNNDPSVSRPSGGSYLPSSMYNLTSVEQTELNGFEQRVFAACCVGGGSTINGMMLNRGSAADYDSWESLGNPGWGWEGLYPYFVKHSHLDAPSDAAVEEFGISWGEESYGDGPIHQSFSSFQFPGLKIQRDALIEAGAEAPADGGAPQTTNTWQGDAYGVIWYPTALDNSTATRSYAVNGYWEPAANRTNLHLLLGFRVDEVLFDEDLRAESVVIRERGVDDAKAMRVQANSEIVIAAGGIHSPQVLQRSGIGPKALLEEAGVEVVVDLPGVGSNFQDHAAAGVAYRFTTDVSPNPAAAFTNETFAEWAANELAENHSGPLRLSTGNLAGMIPLPVIDPEGYEALVEEYLALDAAEYLPTSYTAENLAGYEAQREVLADMMGRSDNAFLELPISAGPSYSVVLIKTLSRGTVMLNPEDIYAEPVVDYRTYSIPTDRHMMRQFVRWIRKAHETEAMSVLGPEEMNPGVDVESDEDIEAFLVNSTSCSTAHNSGTCPMMPKDLGGVVGADLLVHGVTGLSVADSSIMPIIPGTHICSTVYAIAEKAADLIKERNKGAGGDVPVEEPEEPVEEPEEPVEEPEEPVEEPEKPVTEPEEPVTEPEEPAPEPEEPVTEPEEPVED